ncbi:MAG: hypothetical protein VKJ02_18905 [Snowella sp.]|nr:hypothetical protein [Snowella sp.]
MIRQVFVMLTVVMLTVLTIIGNPAIAAEMGNFGTEQSANQYPQTVQDWQPVETVQYAQVSWPFQQTQTRNQGEQTEQYSQSQQPQARNQGEQTQQYSQQPQTQARNQNNQSEQPQYQQQQQTPNQIPSQNNQEQSEQA